MGLIKAGTCVYLPDEGTGKTRLHVVLNDPFGEPPTVALVSLSTTVDYDKTTILAVGDHPYITDETYVVYRRMQAKDVAKLEKAISQDMSIRHHQDCDPALLRRIQDGVFKSQHVRPTAERYCGLALNRINDVRPQAVPATPKRG